MSDTLAITRRIDIPEAGRYSLDPLRSSVTLRTRLFGLQSLSATMYIAAGQIDIDPRIPRATVTATINAASFSTDNPRRDNDVRSARFLHAEKNPDFTFRADVLSHGRGRWTLTGEQFAQADLEGRECEFTAHLTAADSHSSASFVRPPAARLIRNSNPAGPCRRAGAGRRPAARRRHHG